MKKELIVIIALIAGGMWGKEVFAQDDSLGLSVLPEKFELRVERGEVLKDQLRIQNKSTTTLDIEARVLNFTAEDQTGTIQFYAGEKAGDDTSFNPSKWVTLNTSNFTLDAGGDAVVAFSVRVPDNAEPGGKYAVIMFAPKLPPPAASDVGPRIIPQIGALFLLNVAVEGTERPSEPFTLTGFHLALEDRLKTLGRLTGGAYITESSPFRFAVGIDNKDIVHVRPEGKIALFNLLGGNAGEITFRSQTVLPGKTREFLIPYEAQGSRLFFIGRYTAKLELWDENGFRQTATTSFLIFPWKVLLLGFVAFGILGVGFVKIRKRLFGAIRVLVSGRLLRKEKK